MKTNCNLNRASAPGPRGRKMTTLLASLSLMVLITGCASTKVTNQERTTTEALPRPGNIWVYDFASSAAEVVAGSELFGKTSAAQTPEEAELGRKLGALIATELVDNIRKTGMPATYANANSKPQVNDIVIRGSLLSMEEGSAVKRMTIGFGSGASELTAHVEGYQMTAQGLRKLGSGTVDSAGNKTPGAAVGAGVWIATANPAGFLISAGTKTYGELSGRTKLEGRAKTTAKEIGKVLKQRCEEHGWIN